MHIVIYLWMFMWEGALGGFMCISVHIWRSEVDASTFSTSLELSSQLLLDWL